MTSSDDDFDYNEIDLFDIYSTKELDLYMQNGGDINKTNPDRGNASIVGQKMVERQYDFALFCLCKYPVDISIQGAYERTVFFSLIFKDRLHFGIMNDIADKMIELDKTGHAIRMKDIYGNTPVMFMRQLYKISKYKLNSYYKRYGRNMLVDKKDFYHMIYMKYLNHEKRTSTLFELMLKATEETSVNKKRRFH